MMGDTFPVNTGIFSQSERITPRGVQRLVGIASCIICQSLLAGIIPFEDTIRRNSFIQDGWKFGYLKVFDISYETTAIAIASALCGEGNHVTSLQFKTSYLVVQFCCGQSIHEATGILCSEVIDRSTAKILFTVYRQRFDTAAIRHNDGAMIVYLHLTGRIVGCLCAVDGDILQLTDGI